MHLHEISLKRSIRDMSSEFPIKSMLDCQKMRYLNFLLLCLRLIKFGEGGGEVFH